MHLKLKQGVSRISEKAPHKPVLILAVIKAFDTGLISENKIFITPELLSLFRGLWDALVKTRHTPNFALPFFHLRNEKQKFWLLQSAPGFEKIITSSDSVRSLSALQDYVYYAYLSDELYQIMTNIKTRNLLRQDILDTYFNLSNTPYVEDSLTDAINDILNDSQEEYKRKIVNESKQAKALEEEKRFLRGGAFKKIIPRIYNNTCAITKLKVDSIINISMIDACHIVPFSESFNDTITNGIALSPNMHRAFDRGLISIDENYKLLVSSKFTETESVYSIKQFEGIELALPENPNYHPSQISLEYHRQRFNF